MKCQTLMTGRREGLVVGKGGLRSGELRRGVLSTKNVYAVRQIRPMPIG